MDHVCARLTGARTHSAKPWDAFSTFLVLAIAKVFSIMFQEDKVVVTSRNELIFVRQS